eukprot:m.253795 g.253795  ORF g.253795 m.253795 type:complete len:184 (+) comp16164_c1_seq2:197-748(+)
MLRRKSNVEFYENKLTSLGPEKFKDDFLRILEVVGLVGALVSASAVGLQINDEQSYVHDAFACCQGLALMATLTSLTLCVELYATLAMTHKDWLLSLVQTGFMQLYSAANLLLICGIVFFAGSVVLKEYILRGPFVWKILSGAAGVLGIPLLIIHFKTIRFQFKTATRRATMAPNNITPDTTP